MTQGKFEYLKKYLIFLLEFYELKLKPSRLDRNTYMQTPCLPRNILPLHVQQLAVKLDLI